MDFFYGRNVEKLQNVLKKSFYKHFYILRTFRTKKLLVQLFGLTENDVRRERQRFR